MLLKWTSGSKESANAKVLQDPYPFSSPLLPRCLPLPPNAELCSLMARGTKESLSLLVLYLGSSSLSLKVLSCALMKVCRG